MSKAYIQRTSQVNPLLHAVSEINPDAFLIAQNLDNERAAGRVRGYETLLLRHSYSASADRSRPLHGIPILIKVAALHLNSRTNVLIYKG